MTSIKSNPRLKLNPNFLAANLKNPWEEVETQLASATNGKDKIAYEIAQARKTGKLHLTGLSMSLLPDAMFDIRNDLLEKYSGNIEDQNQLKSHEKAWECYGEEMLTMVDLSENDLSKATSFNRFSCFKSLKSLHIHNCQLNTFPWDILKTNLKSLQVLDAHGNRFTTVPMHLLPESITNLNLADNIIENLGDDIYLPNLMKLNLQNNKVLVRLPIKLSTPRLVHADLSGNNIEVIPKDFLLSCKRSLQTLDISENLLTLSMTLVGHSKLQILRLSFNKIQHVPLVHENLVTLDLENNNLSTIEGLYPILEKCNGFGRTGDGDWFRPKLKELNIRRNKISELHPQTMAVMTKLSLLNVADNSLESIPPVVGYLRDLNKIILDGNPFRIIRSAISYRPQGGIDTPKLLYSLRKKDYPPKGPGYHPEAGYAETCDGNEEATSQSVMEAKLLVRQAMEGTKSLNINGRNLTGQLQWPELVDALLIKGTNSKISGSGVVEFQLSDGKLTSFGPEWVNALPCLSTLDARRNCLQSLPSNLSQLPLKTILCYRNCLTSNTFEDVICIKDSTLSSTLTDLDLSMNKLEWIPDALFDLRALRKLNLSKNNIKSLAWQYDEESGKERGWRHGLISLEYLDLSNNMLNNLGYLPLALFGCKKLQTLLLNNNAIYDIPLELGLLEQLSKIDLLGNSQRKIGMRVLTQSTSQILKYLRDRMDENQISAAHINHAEIIEALEEQYSVNIGSAKIDDEGANIIAIKETANEIPSTDTELIESSDKNDEEGTALIEELQAKIHETEIQLQNLSISKAARFALKKELAMQRSKLIRQERKSNPQ